MDKTILLVDDEASILRALERLLSRQSYNVITASSGNEALDMLQQHDVGVVISDFRMPGMDGGELLSKIKVRHPNIICMILSGYADFDTVQDVLNNGLAYKFLNKPWHDKKLITHVQDAFEHWRLKQQQQTTMTDLAMSSNTPAFEIDRCAQVLQMNRSAFELCSSSEQQLIGRRLIEVLPYLNDDQIDQLAQPQEVTLEATDPLNNTLYELNARTSSHQRKIITIRTLHHSDFFVDGVMTRSAMISLLNALTADPDTAFTTIYFDVKNFQAFNDSFGYQKADQFLAVIARKFVQHCPENLHIGRMGGDEFAVVAPQTLSAAAVQEVTNTLLTPFDQLIEFEGYEIYVDFYTGYALSPKDGSTVEALLCNAQAAAIDAKNRGRRHVLRYKPRMNAHSHERLVLQSDLFRALEREELSVVYQPKVSLASGRIVGAEALLRWHHQSIGMISPALFIPMAENNGLIEPIGEWVLATATAQRKVWQKEGLPGFLVSVNLSGRQLQGRQLADKVETILQTSDLKPSQLELEVTETFMIRDLEHSLSTLHELKEMGIRISLDDFGTGYSSLYYLSRMPVDTLKIDRSFIDGLDSSRDRYDLVNNMIRMSHDLGKGVVAEGVENAAQAEILRTLQCDEVQGFYFSPPVTAENFRKLLENQPLIGADVIKSSNRTNSTKAKA